MNSKGEIIIEPTSGLCNRMRAIDSAVALGRKIDKKVIVLWKRDHLLNCPFSQLFKPIEQVTRFFEWRTFNKLDQKLFEIAVNSLMALYCDVQLSQNDISLSMNKGFDFDFLKRVKRIFIRTHSNFLKSDNPFKIFIPHVDLAQVIDSYKVDNNFVGVHIRRKDNFKSITNSPTDLFIKQMENEIALDPLVKFFIASDSFEDKIRIINHFSDRVKFHDVEEFTRNKPGSIKNAVIDLFCLAACRKIIGSYWSSFTRTASQINNAELIVINKSPRQ